MEGLLARAERRLPARSGPTEHGVTLVELMVVILVIGVLVAVAIPAFTGARDRASDTVARSSAQLGFETAMVVYTDTSDFADVDVAGLAAAEGSISFTTAPSTDDHTVSVRSNRRWFRVAVRSGTGWCFYVAARPDEAPKYGARQRNSCRAQHARRFATNDSW